MSNESHVPVEITSNNHVEYHLREYFLKLTFDCSSRCLNYNSQLLSGKEEDCLKECYYTHFENALIDKINW